MAVWLDTENLNVKPLHQWYRRMGGSYDYGTACTATARRILVDDFGAMQEFLDVWTSDDFEKR